MSDSAKTRTDDGAGRPSRSPTLESVAAAAGVSVATASNALSGNRGVSEAARAKVFAAAQRLGYGRSGPRRPTKATKTAVGIVLPDVRNPAYAELAHAFERQGRLHGWSIVLSSTDYDPERELAVLNELTLSTDGVILSPSRPPRSGVHALEASRVPIVSCDEPADSPWVGGSVRSDNFGGGRAAAHHLFDSGGRRFGMIGGHGYLPTTHERREGFIAGLRDRGVGDDAIRIVGDRYGMDAGQSAMYELLRLDPGVDAVFAVSDMHAVGALFEAQQSGRSIPRDLLLCGFDGIGWTAQMSPTITTVRQDWSGIAAAACSMLQTMMSGHEGRKVILPVEIVVGESTTR